MLPVASLDETRALPLDKWGIPAPPDAWATSRADFAATGEVDLILVPCVAFDGTCQRLGHGRGYYGAATPPARAARGAARLVLF
jgi:5-formyltetrahydrofolate cyclo-ligase